MAHVFLLKAISVSNSYLATEAESSCVCRFDRHGRVILVNVIKL